VQPSHSYSDATIAFATKHKKDELVKDLFKKGLGIDIVLSEIDTDQFGTFSGEIERKFSPLDTAIAKARAAVEAGGFTLGLASEGTIGNDPLIPLMISDIEVMVLFDKTRDLVISESYRSFDICALTKVVEIGGDLRSNLQDYLEAISFPEQRLIAKPNSSNDKKLVIKGIDTFEMLISAITELAELSLDKKVLLEPDFRAHFSPSRQQNIRKVSELLIDRMQRFCARCGLPGFGRLSFVRGLNCKECGTLNPDAIKSELLGCISCDYLEPGKTIKDSLEPANCINCNP